MFRRAQAALVVLFISWGFPAWAQVRSLTTESAQQVVLPNTVGGEVVLGSVELGKPRTFTTFNIQAAGRITPDPGQHGAAYQLRLLICDQADCSGDLRSAIRILADADSAAPSQVIATGSFGVSSHSVDPVVLSGFQPHTPSGVLYLAVGLRLLHGSETAAFTGRLNLLRVDVVP